MKLLSLWPPWSSAIASGLKRIETRSWGTTYRGPVAIHSSKRNWSQICDALGDLPRPVVSTLRAVTYPRALWNGSVWEFPLGQIVCICDLADCLPTEQVFDRYPTLDNPAERALGNYTPGRRALVLANIRPLRAPMAFSGFQGLRALPPEIAQKVYERAVA